MRRRERLRFNGRVQVGTTRLRGSEDSEALSLAAATQRLAATLKEMRGELEQTRQLTELARVTAEVRALAAELAATQREFLEAERAAALQEIASLRRMSAEPPTRVEWRSLPTRPRASPTPSPAGPTGRPATRTVPEPKPAGLRAELVRELGELRDLVERVADAEQHDELAGRWERFRQELADPAADCEAIRTEMAVLRALLYRALKPRPASAAAAEAPSAEAVAREMKPIPRRSRAAAVVEHSVERAAVKVLAGVSAGLAVLVVVLLWPSGVQPVGDFETAAASVAPAARPSVAPAAAVAQPVARTSGALATTAASATGAVEGRYVDPAGRFSCELPEGWEVTADSSELLSSLRLRRDGDEILVLSRPAIPGQFDLEDRSATERRLARQVNQLTKGELFAEVVEAKWVTSEGLEALQMVLRLAVGAETWRVLALNYQQHGHDHLLLLYVRSHGREPQLQATFQKFVYEYNSSGEEEPVAAELPFLRGVVADALARPVGVMR